jgi:hypothetical protein
MVEAAGFEVSIAYRLTGGENRLANSICRLLFGTDQVRIATAVKPTSVEAVEGAAPPEAVAVG